MKKSLLIYLKFHFRNFSEFKHLFWIIFLVIVSCNTTKNLSQKNLGDREQYAQTQLQYSNFYYEKNDLKKAIKYMKRVVEAVPEKEAYLKQLANLYLECGDANTALAYISDYRSSCGDDNYEKVAELYLYEGIIRLSNYTAESRNDPEGSAIKCFGKGLETMNTYQVDNPVLYACLHNAKGVAEIFDQGYNYPANPAIAGGLYRINMTDVQRAKKSFTKALENHILSPEIKFNLLLMEQFEENQTGGVLKVDNVISVDFENLLNNSTSDIIDEYQEEYEVKRLIEMYGPLIETKKGIDEIVFVVDISGSMQFLVSPQVEKTRFEAMKEAVRVQVESLDEEVQKIGFLTVGGQECDDAPLVKIKAELCNKDKILSVLSRLEMNGKTPLYQRLELSSGLFTKEPNNKMVFLASDGIAGCDCEKSFCELANDLCGQSIKTEVLSLLLDERSNFKEYGAYSCMTNACNAHLFKTKPTLGVEEKIISISDGYPWLQLDQQDIINGVFTPRNNESLTSISEDKKTTVSNKNLFQ